MGTVWAAGSGTLLFYSNVNLSENQFLILEEFKNEIRLRARLAIRVLLHGWISDWYDYTTFGIECNIILENSL